MRTKAIPPQATVLLSGGLDSTACVAFFKLQSVSLSAVFVDYGQRSATREEYCARAVANHFEVDLAVVRCSGVRRKATGTIDGRNAFLVFTALMESPMPAGLIALGVHAGTEYWDCGREFTGAIQALLDGYTGGRIRLATPFAEWNKREIWQFCQKENVPVDLTYSCEQANEQPCGTCGSCRDRILLNDC